MSERYPVTIYFDSDEQRRRFRMAAASRGVSASELGKEHLVRTLALDAPFFAPSVPLVEHSEPREDQSPVAA